MRWIARMAAAVLVLTSPALGQQASQKPKAAQGAAAQGKTSAGDAVQMDQAGLDQLLARWEQRSSEMKTLDAQFRRKDDLVTLGDKEYYQGRAMLKSPNLVVLQFSRTDKDFTKKPVLEERIVCTADEVWQFGYKLKQIVIHTLDQDQKRRALQQGPLPFLFNMKAADAKKRYEMTAWADSKNQLYHIKIVPRQREDRENFLQAGVTLDMKEFLPKRMILHDPNGKDQKTFLFDAIVRNTSWSSDPFTPQLVNGWEVIRNPVGEPQPEAGAGARPNDDAAIPASNKNR